MRATSPNGGEVFRCGSTATIAWFAQGIDRVRIEYSPYFGNEWFILAPNMDAMAGNFAWTLPEGETSGGVIRITDADSPASDTNNEVFSILRYNVHAGYVADTDLAAAGYQGPEWIPGAEGGKLVGFALYAQKWENAKGLTLSFSWDPGKAEFMNTLSSPQITADAMTVNGGNIHPPAESNILASTLSERRGKEHPRFLHPVLCPSGRRSDNRFHGADFPGDLPHRLHDHGGGFAHHPRRGHHVGRERDGKEIWECALFTVTPGLLPPGGVTVSDVPATRGTASGFPGASPSEARGYVSGYRIFRSRTSTLTPPVPLSRLATLDSLLFYEERCTILVDSVTAGVSEFIDPFAPKRGATLLLLGAGLRSRRSERARFPVDAHARGRIPEAFRMPSVSARLPPTRSILPPPSGIPSPRCAVSLRVYNVSGQKVATLVEGAVFAGRHSAVWDARGMPSGVYFYTLMAEEGYGETKKVLLLK